MAKNPRAAECQYRIYPLLGTILHAWENTNDFPAGAIFDGGTRGVSQAVVKVVNGRARWGGGSEGTLLPHEYSACTVKTYDRNKPWLARDIGLAPFVEGAVWHSANALDVLLPVLVLQDHYKEFRLCQMQ